MLGRKLSGLPRMWFGRPFVTLITVNKLSEVVTWIVLLTIVRLFCSELNYYKRVVVLEQCNTHHSSCTELVILWYFAVEIVLLLFSQCLTLCDHMDYSMPGFPVLHHLPEFAQIHVYWVSDAIQLSHSLLPPSPPAFNLSQHQGLFDESALRIRWPKYYWSFSFSISPSNEYSDPLGLPGLISLLSRDS